MPSFVSLREQTVHLAALTSHRQHFIKIFLELLGFLLLLLTSLPGGVISGQDPMADT